MRFVVPIVLQIKEDMMITRWCGLPSWGRPYLGFDTALAV